MSKMQIKSVIFLVVKCRDKVSIGGASLLEVSVEAKFFDFADDAFILEGGGAAGELFMLEGFIDGHELAHDADEYLVSAEILSKLLH